MRSTPLEYLTGAVILGPYSRIQVTLYRRLRIGRDGHLDQSEAYATSTLVHGGQYVYIAKPRTLFG